MVRDSQDLLRKFSKFLENECKFVVEDKNGKPYIKDPLYEKAYKSVPECRFPKQRGQNSIIGTIYGPGTALAHRIGDSVSL